MTTEKKTLRQKLRELPNFDKEGSTTPLSVSLDSGLTHADRTCWDMIEYHQQSGTCWMSLRDLADVLATDVHQVHRSVKRLELCGHVKRLMRGPHLMGIEITSKYFDKAERIEAGSRCSRCKRDIKVDAVGVCQVCRKQETANREVAEYFQVHGHCVLRDVWSDLKAHGSKSSQKNIERAYNALLDARATG